jgi:hypothetical protein
LALEEFLVKEEKKAPVIVIVGSGIESTQRIITYEKGQQLAEAHGALYIELSARKSINIEQLFELIMWLREGRGDKSV